MTLRMHLLLGLICFFAVTAFAADSSESEYQTFSITKGQFDHFIAELEHSYNLNHDDKCLNEMKDAMRRGIEPSCKDALIPVDGMVDVVMPFVASSLWVMCGHLLGDLSSATPDPILAAKIAGAVILWCTAWLFYCQIPIMHNKKMSQYTQEFPNSDMFIERLNNFTFENINVLQISKKPEDGACIIKVHKTIVESLKKLDLPEEIFSEGNSCI